MNKTIRWISTKGKILSFLSLVIVAISTYGANTKCVAIFHDVKKPRSLDSLKKY